MSTITNAVNKDHCDLVDYYKKILNAPDNDTATRWQNQFTWALSRHLVAEEHVLYPAFKNSLGERGTIIVDKYEFEHQSVIYLKFLPWFIFY
jgi:hemerythrin superfamily protein